jgi:phosphoribosylaminoimidazolecarboxamide formyltransferase/IMP cyclohydrolase
MSLEPQPQFEGDLPIRRALISVYDKIEIVDFAQALVKKGVEIVSTGGTAKRLSAAGVKVTTIEGFTKFGEMLDGRLKTLQPEVQGPLLANKANPGHMGQLAEAGFPGLDMVVINLYPFEKVAADPNATEAQLIENIDIGGITCIRAGAKNFGSICVVTSPSQYLDVAGELEANNGKISLATRRQLRDKAFEATSKYETTISNKLNSLSTVKPRDTEGRQGPARSRNSG